MYCLGHHGVAFLNRKPPEEKKTELASPVKRKAPEIAKPVIPFENITESAGIDWKHFNAMEGEKLLPEAMGGGVTIFYFDSDGDQDILFIGGESWSWALSIQGNPCSLCLYANDGTARFTDVTEQSGLKIRMQAMGASVGDYDDDGWPDLSVTGVGGSRLYRNQQGKFTDVTEAAGVKGSDEDWDNLCDVVRLRQ